MVVDFRAGNPHTEYMNANEARTQVSLSSLRAQLGVSTPPIDENGDRYLITESDMDLIHDHTSEEIQDFEEIRLLLEPDPWGDAYTQAERDDMSDRLLDY